MTDAVFLIAGLGVVLLCLSVGLVMLWVRCRRLQVQLNRMHHRQQGQQRDVAGLCEAAVKMDRRIRKMALELEEIREWCHESQHQASNEARSYQIAIERIQQGAGIEELVAECGFTREEASLLLRLHQAERGGSYPGS